MFMSSEFFKHIDCPFFKHDLCHRPYCHFKHIASAAESVTTVNRCSISQSLDGCPDPFSSNESLGDEILKIISNYTPYQQDSTIIPTSSKEVNNEIFEALEQPNEESQKKLVEEELTDDIIDIVLKFKTKHDLSDSMPDRILTMVKNITPKNLFEYVHLAKDVSDVPRLTDFPNSSVRMESEYKYHSTVGNATTATAEHGLIDSFYSKEKVSVNITSGENISKSTSLSPIVKGLNTQIFCNCDDPDCSGAIDDQCNFEDIDDEYTKRKNQRRLERKNKLAQTTVSVIMNDDSYSEPRKEENKKGNVKDISPDPDLDKAFTFVLDETSRAFNNNPEKKDISDKSTNLYMNLAGSYIDVDINEQDFFIHPTEIGCEFAPELPPNTLSSDLDDKRTDDDLSKYIDKCKEEYARKKKKKQKQNDLNPLIIKEGGEVCDKLISEDEEEVVKKKDESAQKVSECKNEAPQVTKSGSIPDTIKKAAIGTVVVDVHNEVGEKQKKVKSRKSKRDIPQKHERKEKINGNTGTEEDAKSICIKNVQPILGRNINKTQSKSRREIGTVSNNLDTMIGVPESENILEKDMNELWKYG